MLTHRRLVGAALVAATTLALAGSAAAQWTNYIEIEDYNFESGKFISDASSGMAGPYVGGVFTNKLGTRGVDWDYTKFREGSTTISRVYRTDDYNNGIYLSDRKQAVNIDRGYFSVTYNWKLAYQDPGEWQNYTRVFSNAVYAITIFAGADNNLGVRMSLEQVSSDPSLPNQSTESLAYFNGPNTGGVDVYALLEATDAVGQPLRIRLSGTNTLRLTQRHFSNSDYLKFVAQEAMTVMPPYLSVVSPANGETMTGVQPINITIRRGDYPIDPTSLRLSVNGTEVTSAIVVSTNAGGAAVTYDYDRGLPTSTLIPVEFSFADTATPANTVTNTWSFTTPATWPIFVSTSRVDLYTNQVSSPITVSIPRGLNAVSDVEVDLTSSNPNVAIPQSGSGGVLPLIFPAGGTNVLTFAVETLAEGTAQITTENGWGLTVASIAVGVTTGLPVLAPDLPSSGIAYPGRDLVLRVGVQGGEAPFSYQWQSNGVVIANGGRISGATTNVLGIANAGTADSALYQVFVSNGRGTTASTPCALTVSPRLTFGGNGGGWILNGSPTLATLSDNQLTLTEGAGNTARSAFFSLPLYVGGFRASFTYQDVGGGGADGVAFILHNDPRGPAALGGNGGSLGYAGISPSLALGMNIYVTAGFAVCSNGVIGAYSPTTPIDIRGGDPIRVALTYAGGQLSLRLTNLTTLDEFTADAALDLTGILETNTAWLGFSGATGGAASTQWVTDFAYVPLPLLRARPAAEYSVALSWPASVGGFVLQSRPGLAAGAWTDVSTAATRVEDQWQVTLTPLAGQTYFRLVLP